MLGERGGEGAPGAAAAARELEAPRAVVAVRASGCVTPRAGYAVVAEPLEPATWSTESLFGGSEGIRVPSRVEAASVGRVQVLGRRREQEEDGSGGCVRLSSMEVS